ncbi:MAG: glycosyltransferase family 4 protein [Syntrophobacteraceae bacterium]
MNVLFLSHVENIAPRVLQEIDTLIGMGHKVSAIAWNTSGNRYEYPFPVQYVDNRSRVRLNLSLGDGLGVTLGRIGALYPKTFKEAINSSWDVIHCCHISMLPVALAAKMLTGSRIVYDSYEFPSQNLSARIRNARLAFLTRKSLEVMEKLFASVADAILTIPSMGDEERLKFSKYCRNVEVLWNVPSAVNSVSEKNFSHPPSAVFIGGSTREKGLFVMIEAAAMVCENHPDFRLTLIGPVMENMEEVKRKVSGLGVGKNVVFHSWVPPHRLDGFLASSWMGLWPNQPVSRFARVTTGNSRKGFEYMKHGLPVVASAYGEIAKAVREEHAGLLVDTASPGALAGAILRIIDDSELRSVFSRNGMIAVKEKYNWEKQAFKVVKVYENLER